MDPTIDPVWLRGVLAEQQITHLRYAEACHLSRVFVGRVLAGNVKPGELARRKLYDGIVRLGLDRQAVSA